MDMGSLTLGSETHLVRVAKDLGFSEQKKLLEELVPKQRGKGTKCRYILRNLSIYDKYIISYKTTMKIWELLSGNVDNIEFFTGKSLVREMLTDLKYILEFIQECARYWIKERDNILSAVNYVKGAMTQLNGILWIIDPQDSLRIENPSDLPSYRQSMAEALTKGIFLSSGHLENALEQLKIESGKLKKLQEEVKKDG